MTQGNDSDDAKAIAAPVRQILKNLLSRTIRTQEERKRVAAAIGKSVKTLNSAIYEGKGGLDVMAAALIVSRAPSQSDYDLFETALLAYFLNDANNAAPSTDNLWRKLSGSMTETEKTHLLMAMEFYLKLNRSKS